MPAPQRLGAAQSEFHMPDDIDRHNDEAAALFLADPSALAKPAAEW